MGLALLYGSHLHRKAEKLVTRDDETAFSRGPTTPVTHGHSLTTIPCSTASHPNSQGNLASCAPNFVSVFSGNPTHHSEMSSLPRSLSMFPPAVNTESCAFPLGLLPASDPLFIATAAAQITHEMMHRGVAGSQATRGNASGGEGVRLARGLLPGPPCGSSHLGSLLPSSRHLL